MENKIKASASVDAMVAEQPKAPVKQEKKEVKKEEFKFSEKKEIKNISITRRVKEAKNKVYQLMTGKPTAATIPTLDIVFDKAQNINVEIRYAPGESSILVSKQGEKVRREPIIFRDGILIVPKENPTLINYLDTCNYNHSNPDRRSDKNGMFKVLDNTKDFKKINNAELLKAEIITAVMKTPLDKLLKIARVYGVNIDREIDLIKHDVKVMALKDPKRFHEILNSKSTDAKALILEARARGILSFKGQTISWTKSGGVIVNAPLGIRALNHLTDLCMTEEGLEFLKELKKRLS